jgi:hypothetical protein
MSFPFAVLPHRMVALALLLASATCLTPALAVPGNYQIVQTATDSQSYNSFNSGANSTGSWSWVASTANINPFSSYNTGSGTLNSVTIEWAHVLSFSGTTGSSGGSFSGGGGSNASVNSLGYSGYGGGNGTGAAPNSPISTSATWCASTPSCAPTFTAANAGVTYDPRLWPILSGISIYTVASTPATGAEATWSDIVSGSISMNSTVTVTYDYFGEPLPASVPLAPTAALLGLGLGAIGLNRRGRRRIIQ